MCWHQIQKYSTHLGHDLWHRWFHHILGKFYSTQVINHITICPWETLYIILYICSWLFSRLSLTSFKIIIFFFWEYFTCMKKLFFWSWIQNVPLLQLHYRQSFCYNYYNFTVPHYAKQFIKLFKMVKYFYALFRIIFNSISMNIVLFTFKIYCIYFYRFFINMSFLVYKFVTKKENENVAMPLNWNTISLFFI